MTMRIAFALVAALSLPTALAAQERQPAQQEQPAQQQQAQLSADAHHLIGKKAMGQQGKEVGEVKDVLVGQDGKVQAVVVEHRGKDRAVPWAELSMQADQLSVKMNDQQLSQLPEYKSEKE